MKFRILSFIGGVMLSALLANSAFAQGTAFTYQGRLLLNGATVNGTYDLQFILHPALGATNQVGPTLTNSAVGVTNSLFTVQLDFGDVFTISPLYLEIGLRTNGGGSFTILSPSQLLTSAPYAVQALTATTFLGLIGDAQLSANVPRLNGTSVFTGPVTINNLTAAGSVNGTLSGTFSGASSGTFSGTATGTLIGNGGGITNLNATNVVGVVQSNPNWQLIQGPSQQAAVANNYLTTNSVLTSLILPATPNVGSTLRVAGSGANGFVLSQAVGESIMTAALNLPAGQLWVVPTSFPDNLSEAWHAAAASDDGLKMAAAYDSGYIYFSNNGGQSWAKSAATAGNIFNPWVGLAMSADGSRMVAVPNGGYIWTSINGGTNFTQQTGGLSANTFWTCVASSADGVKLVAAIGSGNNGIYTSSNSGTNWTQRTITAQNWAGIACSADGTKIAAVASGISPIYTSADSGTTWTNRGPANISWSAIASSATGNKLVATANTGLIYTSGDAGVTWTPHASAQAWTCVTSSADGDNLAAAYHGYIYTSQDSGLTWLQRTNGVNSVISWNNLASSASGSRLLAVANTGSIYTSTAATTVGSLGALFGSQYSSIEIQYIGNGSWMPLSFLGTFKAN